MGRKRNPSISNVWGWINKGKGQGTNTNYQPFFHVRDVPSRGRSSMIFGQKTGRIHHYLSNMEYSCHILAEYASSVTDIREQYALLPWSETQMIADGLGIRHPIYRGTKTPIVMTSDLVLSYGKEKTAVLCVKPYSETDPMNPHAKRVMEKLLIEKMYWDRRGIQWQLITEREIPTTRVQNLDQLRMGVATAEHAFVISYMDFFLSAFHSVWTRESSLLCILTQVSTKINLAKEQCYSLFAKAVWSRLLDVDLDVGLIHHDQPIPLITRSGDRQC